jgi:acyl carrier protein
MTDTEINKQIIQFIAHQISEKPEKIFLETRINIDLGVDGDDAVELLDEFSTLFNVDLSHFQHDKYFGPEAGGGDLIGLILWTLYWTYCKVFGKIYNPSYSVAPITIQDLVKAVETGRLEM